MRKLFKRSIYVLMFAVISTGFVFSAAYAQEGLEAASDSLAIQAEETVAYWTPERMASAIPVPFPEVVASAEDFAAEAEAAPSGPPGFVDGTLPDQAFDPVPTEGAAPQFWGGPPGPGNWLNSYPGPFQRWSWFGRYLTYPTSTIGKVFFTRGGSRFVCSGATINAGGGQRDVVSTAGHCVHPGGGGAFHTNVLFCPSYVPPGPNPSRGCWPAVNLITFTAWTVGGHIEADVACIVARNFGDTIGDHVGNVAGTLGRSWNWGFDEPFISFGYPAGPPMHTRNGGLIVIATGPGWYTRNWGGTDVDGSPLADSVYMGNDMTGGSSGGPWVLGWEHRNTINAYPDTDGNNLTDPFPGGATSARIVGNNSHRIIVGGVVRTQEMGSAQYTTGHPNTETLWSACASSANSD